MQLNTFGIQFAGMYYEIPENDLNPQGGFMKSLIVGATLGILITSNAHACEEMHTTQAIVDYVCNYSLVSDTQCRIWKEDMRQMNHNNQIIVDSFISWDSNLEEQQNMFAKQYTEN